MRRPRTHFLTAHRGVQQIINGHGFALGLRLAKLIDLWPSICGQEVARNSQPVRLRGGVLVIEAENGYWVTALNHEIPRLIEKVNTALESPTVSQIHVVVKASRPQ